MPFQASYEPLSDPPAEWGRIALLPWDEEIFGFPVADLESGPRPLSAEDLPAFLDALREFCARTGARLVSARTPAGDNAAISLLETSGFLTVDFSLQATLTRLKPAAPRFVLREATPEDHGSVCRIAGTAFQFGRYHTDPRFPRDLANARYVRWVQNSLGSEDPGNLVFVLGQPGKVEGFMDVVIRGSCADLRLGAADPQNGSGIAGGSLYAETLRVLHDLGVRSATAKISAANTRVLNILSMLHFQFSNPEITLHWHAPEWLAKYGPNPPLLEFQQAGRWPPQ